MGKIRMKVPYRKITVVTGSRSEYGLLYALLKTIDLDPDLELALVAASSHLSQDFGLTIREIERDGFKIAAKIDMLEPGDSAHDLSKSIGQGVLAFADLYARLAPDLIVVCGDRYELLSACIPAMMAKIPLAHIHGGEKTEGSLDDSIRHAITKMSHIHFTATEEYRRRVIQMGESPDRVFNVGAPGLDYLNEVKLLSKKEFERDIDFELGRRNFLLTFHAPSFGEASIKRQVRSLLRAVEAFPDAKILMTQSNADANNRQVNEELQTFARKHEDRARLFDSLGRRRYLSALQYVDLVIGNSSSGIHEVPSFHKPTVNVGDRQEGRMKARSVIDCEPETQEIVKAIKKGLSPSFRKNLKRIKNPYGAGEASLKIKEILKKIELGDALLKKKFHDLRWSPK